MTIEDRISEALTEPMAADARRALDLRVRAVINGTPPRRRRFSVTRGLALAGLLAIALPSVIVGGLALTESPLGLESATEFAAEIEAAKLVVPLPEGRTWPDFLQPDDPNASYSRGGGLPTVESVATCIWFDEWLDASAASDQAREETAANTIADIPNWESWNSRSFDQSYRDYKGSIIAAVGRGEEKPVRDDIAINCSWLVEE